jgi:hypothetical protein
VDSLSRALHHSQKALRHHEAGEHDGKEFHLHMVGKHLDKALAQATKDAKTNPSKFRGANARHHPIARHVKAIEDILKHIPDHEN